MTANPLALVQTSRPKLSKQEWVDRGNAYLVEIGRAHECRWYLENGNVRIGYVR